MTTDTAEPTHSAALRSDVWSVFTGYPQPIREKLLILRQLIFDTAATMPRVEGVEETLKWGEPAYLVPGGSTIRLAWKAKLPDNYGIYFNCNTKLVDTFKELYRDALQYEGNRAIRFHRDDSLPVEIISECVELALDYHARKHLALLGA